VQKERRHCPPICVLCDIKRLSREEFISPNTCRIFFMLYGTNEGNHLSFSWGRIGGRRGTYWAAVQKEGNKAQEG